MAKQFFLLKDKPNLKPYIQEAVRGLENYIIRRGTIDGFNIFRVTDYYSLLEMIGDKDVIGSIGRIYSNLGITKKASMTTVFQVMNKYLNLDEGEKQTANISVAKSMFEDYLYANLKYEEILSYLIDDTNIPTIIDEIFKWHKRKKEVADVKKSIEVQFNLINADRALHPDKYTKALPVIQNKETTKEEKPKQISFNPSKKLLSNTMVNVVEDVGSVDEGFTIIESESDEDNTVTEKESADVEKGNTVVSSENAEQINLVTKDNIDNLGKEILVEDTIVLTDNINVEDDTALENLNKLAEDKLDKSSNLTEQDMQNFIIKEEPIKQLPSTEIIDKKELEEPKEIAVTKRSIFDLSISRHMNFSGDLINDICSDYQYLYETSLDIKIENQFDITILNYYRLKDLGVLCKETTVQDYTKLMLGLSLINVFSKSKKIPISEIVELLEIGNYSEGSFKGLTTLINPAYRAVARHSLPVLEEDGFNSLEREIVQLLQNYLTYRTILESTI